MSIAMERGTHPNRITVDEYHRMAEVGLLAPDARVELIEGVIVEMSPVGFRHSSAVNRLVKRLINAVGDRNTVWCQASICLSLFSEPQPDIALLASPEDMYSQRHPTAEDVLLAVEVSDTSLRYDLNTKAALYAKHGIQELWVIDVVDLRTHVFRQPADERYREAFIAGALDHLEISALPGIAIDLSQVLR
jgi:Uma2 family endonuclease